MSPMHPKQRLSAVILAAGASSRFGSSKQRAPFDGGTMLDAVIAAARAAGLEPIVVAPPDLVLPADVSRVVNDRPSEGLSRSLRLGLAAVPADVGAAVILLGDQPTIGAALLRRLVAARGPRPIVATEAAGVLAPPVLLEREAFSLADETVGDAGLRDLLRTRPDLVSAATVARHAPDVDEPADLDAISERCPGCGARWPPHPTDETHTYIGASPACWAAYGELLAREFGDPAYGRVHRHTVDVYTVQHPGTDGRRQRQSIALHLIALCHWLEHDLDGPRINRITQRLASESREWPWLVPPREYELTVRDALAAESGDEHVSTVRRWAASAWEAWSAHHELIRRWAAETLH
jgi:CTP:molybdopterin cytidylyltransferase MocA